MKKIASSPKRHTFQMENYVKRQEEEGKLPNPAYLEMYKSWREQDKANLEDEKWQKNNLEYDLRTSEELCAKVTASENYAQNLYAAMCNMEWQKREFWPELAEERWSCSWRSAGGIIADMREEGDYIDWYCSGIGTKEAGYGLDGFAATTDSDGRDFVPEGTVTEEIELDLNKLGWRPVPYKDEDL